MASEIVVIGVVPRDRLSIFPRCLEALYAHTDGPFRVVLVAGGADHTIRQHLQTLQAQYANLSVVLMDKLLEQATTRNLVLQHLHERFCVLIENDTLVHPHWLPPLLECMRDERAAVVAPLLLDFWEGTIHTAGGMVHERARDGAVAFSHESMHPRMPPAHVPLQRARIAYAEAHCLLIDRQQLPDPTLFDDVEPFDVDLGLTLRSRKLAAFLEPRSRATYLTPPPLQATEYQPGDKDCLRGVPNHPVVWVSWHEARRYCEWLSEQLRIWEGTPEPLARLLRHQGWQVTLPSEAEWEKAARGTDGRIHPWGSEPDPNRANYADTGINTTSAVGCFPGGASPYMIEDLSGNVLEWTRSLWGKYPYPTDEQAQAQRENLDAGSDVARVWRGGAFSAHHRLVRCAYRGRSYPYLRGNIIGFRVVVRPCR